METLDTNEVISSSITPETNLWNQLALGHITVGEFNRQMALLRSTEIA